MDASSIEEKAKAGGVADQQRLTSIVRTGFVAMLVLGIILISVTIYRLNEFNASMTAIVDVHNKKTSLASAMRDAIRQRAVNIYTMLATDDYFIRDEEVFKFYENAGKYRGLREELVRLEMSVREREIHSQLAVSTSVAQPANQRIVDLIMGGASVDEISDAVKVGLAAQRHLLDLLNNLIELQYEYTNVAAERNREVYRVTRLFLLATGACVLVIGGLIARSVTRYVREKSQELTRKNLELASAYQKAEEATKAKSTFLANMSHEIRTPMNGVLGMLDLIRETRLTSEQKHFLETAYNSSESLLTVINDILDLSKIEAGKLTFENISFDLRGLVEEVVALYIKDVHAKNVELISYISPEVPVVALGDPTRIRQILNNLIGNAVKFTKEGEIRISLETTATAGYQREYRFEISDTGIGIPGEAQTTIFETFTQADGTTTRRFGGTGLGLAICKQMTRMLGGDIGVKSDVGVGSVFWFTIRLDDVPDSTLTTKDVFSKLPLSLMVFDRKPARRETVCLYAKAICNEVSCFDGEQSLSILLMNCNGESALPITILLDADLDELKAAELRQDLVTIKAAHNIKLILIVDALQSRQYYSIWEGLADGRISKPIRYAALYDTLKSCTTPRTKIEPTESKFQNEVSSPVSNGESDGKRVLLVEDNIVNQQVASAILSNIGYEVTIAENGKEAVDVVQDMQFDIIIMDCQMPIMDGMEATRKIRQLEERDGLLRTPIVAITANALDGDRVACLAAGMDDYLSKPLHKDSLIKTLSKWSISKTELSQYEDDRYCMKTIEGLLEALDPGQFDEVVDLFLSHTREKVSLLRQAMESGDYAAIESLAHSIKGSAANMGATQLFRFSNQILQDVRTGSISDRDYNIFKQLEREYWYLAQRYMQDIHEMSKAHRIG